VVPAVIALVASVLLAAAAVFAVRLLKGPAPGADVATGTKRLATGTLAAVMLAAFVFPFAAGLPNMWWWLPPVTVALAILDGARRRKRFRRGVLIYSAFMLLTAGMVELVFWLGGSLFAA